MIVLGIDLGLHMGYAALDESGDRLDSGLIRIDKVAKQGRATRWQAFLASLEHCRTTAGEHGTLEAVAWEEGHRFQSRPAQRVYYGFMALLELWVSEHDLKPMPCRDPRAIKKGATGSPKATKEQMIDMAARHWKLPKLELSDHEADALWIAEWARRQIQFNNKIGPRA